MTWHKGSRALEPQWSEPEVVLGAQQLWPAFMAITIVVLWQSPQGVRATRTPAMRKNRLINWSVLTMDESYTFLPERIKGVRCHPSLGCDNPFNQYLFWKKKVSGLYDLNQPFSRRCAKKDPKAVPRRIIPSHSKNLISLEAVVKRNFWLTTQPRPKPRQPPRRE